MKNLFLSFIIVLFFFNTKAQDPSWSKAYNQLYGTQKEYKEQVARRKEVGYDLYQLVGHKSYYANGPSGFLQQTRYYNMDVKEQNGKMTYILTRSNEDGRTNKCYLTFWLDNDDRVTKARFTGEADDLAFLFRNYWPSTNIATSSQRLIKGVITEKKLEGENIVFNYSGRKPYIEISKLN